MGCHAPRLLLEDYFQINNVAAIGSPEMKMTPTIATAGRALKHCMLKIGSFFEDTLW
jgi:hypothetical protein